MDFELRYFDTVQSNDPLIFQQVRDGNLDYLVENAKNLNSSLSKLRHGCYNLCHIAASHGHLEILQWFKEQGYTNLLTQKNHKGVTPLMYAAYKGHLHIIKWFANELPESLNEKDDKNYTLLMIATGGHQLEIVKWLIESERFLEGSKSSLEEFNSKGQNALMIAASAGDLEIFSHFMNYLKEAKLLNCLTDQDEKQKTALIHALEGKNKDIVQLLLNAIPNTNIFFEAILWALKNKQFEVIFTMLDGAPEVLIETGKVNKKDYADGDEDEEEEDEDDFQDIHPDQNIYKRYLTKSGMTITLYAARYGHLELIQKLINDYGKILLAQNTPDGINVFLIAVMFKHLDLVKWIVNSHEKMIRHFTNSGTTSLMFAAHNKDLDMLKLLVETNGTKSLCTKDQYGNTALTYALLSGDLNVVKWILEQIKPFVKNLQFDEPVTSDWLDDDLRFDALLHAAYNGNLELVQWLINGKQELCFKTNGSGQTVIMYAAKGKHLHIIEWLIQIGGMELLDQKDNRGESMVIFFITGSGLDFNLKSIDGNLIKSNAEGATSIKKLIKQLGIGIIGHQDNEGYSLVQLASLINDWRFLLELMETGSVNLQDCINFESQDDTDFDKQNTIQIINWEAKRQQLESKLPPSFMESYNDPLDEEVMQAFIESQAAYMKDLSDTTIHLKVFFCENLAKLIYDYLEFDYYGALTKQGLTLTNKKSHRLREEEEPELKEPYPKRPKSGFFPPPTGLGLTESKDVVPVPPRELSFRIEDYDFMEELESTNQNDLDFDWSPSPGS